MQREHRVRVRFHVKQWRTRRCERGDVLKMTWFGEQVLELTIIVNLEDKNEHALIFYELLNV